MNKAQRQKYLLSIIATSKLDPLSYRVLWDKTWRSPLPRSFHIFVRSLFDLNSSSDRLILKYLCFVLKQKKFIDKRNFKNAVLDSRTFKYFITGAFFKLNYCSQLNQKRDMWGVREAWRLAPRCDTVLATALSHDWQRIWLNSDFIYFADSMFHILSMLSFTNCLQWTLKPILLR